MLQCVRLEKYSVYGLQPIIKGVMKKLKLILKLFLTMFKIGLFTFGGGYAMIALLENEFVSKKKWMTAEEFMDMVAIAESTPGPIAINSATYIGYKQAGVLGSLSATLGVVLPSFSIIYAISLFFDAFLSLTLVSYAFRGIQACVVYLILSAGLKMVKEVKKKPMELILLVLALLISVCFSLFAVKFSTVFYVLIGGSVGVLTYLISKIKSASVKAVGQGATDENLETEVEKERDVEKEGE